MEALAAVLRKGSAEAARSEKDQFYEDIEAPKFVDLTAPDRSRPDDRFWFCGRIGCDQNHEEVDPDALFKSFLLRVMAARSPNVRLQKALGRQQAPSAIAKCPRSAPAKSAKSRATKLGVLGSISEKVGISSKLKVHPITSLRSTPNHDKAAKRPPTAEKAMTTPRNRMHHPKEEPFRSAKNSTVRAPAPKNKAVVKALIFQTPKRAEDAAASARRTPITELSAGMKKIRLGSNQGTASGVTGSDAQANKPLSKVRDTPMDQDACRVERINKELGSGSVCEERKEGEERAPPSSSVSSSGDQTGIDVPDNPKGKDPREKPEDASACNGLGDEQVEQQKMENSSNFDENKENTSASYNTNRDMDLNTIENETENCQNKSFNIPQKARTPQEPSAQGAKYKALRPTHPKPFRLRTDERGILREANLERGKPHKETTVIKTQGRKKLVSIKMGRPEEPESVPSTQRTKPLQDCEEKSARKTKNKARLPAPQQLLKPPSVTAQENASISLLGGKKERQAATLRPKERACKPQAENSTNPAAMSPLVKKAITIPKEPVFHKINIPKGCTKRFKKAS